VLRRQYAFPAAVLAAAAIAALVVVIVNSGGDGKDKASAGGKCADVPAPAPRDVSRRRPPSLRLDRAKTYTATVETSCGTFAIRLDPKQAPKTGGSFVTLARDKFYDGLAFHRVVSGFVIQGGDPSGDGTGGPGYKVRERPPADVVYSEGTVAMAKGGPEPAGTSGSQFFVVTGADSGLQPDYALLGQVTTGLDVVHRIEDQADSAAGPQGGRPKKPVVIKTIRISTE
jgi:peptidyl-prolyl cis-trans isomerase B (cyclophilin B)